MKKAKKIVLYIIKRREKERKNEPMPNISLAAADPFSV
jgi:hypothetical protein